VIENTTEDNMKHQTLRGYEAEPPKPPIILTASDYCRLTHLVTAAGERMPEVVDYLTDELERAQVLPEGKAAPDVVCMGSEVVFRDDQTGKVQRVILVFPGEADIAQGRISVMTPIGAALIGLSVGQSIAWTTRSGETKNLTILQIGARPSP
jgi:regulator of nucleoside diphosphate kinase